jgi:thiol-disulfide isomerase/thioredoxin
MSVAAFPRRRNDWLFIVAFLAILTGFILSVLSLLTVCTEECAESHYWHLFGMPFEYTGLLFFIPLLAFHLLSMQFPEFTFIGGLMLSAALGAELQLTLVQKYKIGAWCPICLAIAACILCAALCYGIIYFIQLNSYLKHGPKGKLMKRIWQGIAGVFLLIFGFIIALVGVSKFNPLEASEKTIKESLFFGDSSSPIEVYIFTDWACPACRELDPELDKMASSIIKKGKLAFVDHAIHTETLNYSPYNVSFMIKNKPEYFRLRNELTKLSAKTPDPTEAQIEKIAESQGVKYQQMNFADIALSQKYFKELAKQFNVTGTPTVIIVNTQTKKGKKLTGIAEITESNILKAMDSLQNNNPK